MIREIQLRVLELSEKWTHRSSAIERFSRLMQQGTGKAVVFLYFWSGLQFQTRIQGRPGHQLIWILPMTSQHNHLSIRYRKRWHHLTPATQWRHCELLAGHPDSSLLTLRKSSSTERGSLEVIVLFEMWQINSFVQVFIATWQLALYLSRTFSLHHTIWGLTQQFDFVFKSR